MLESEDILIFQFLFSILLTIFLVGCNSLKSILGFDHEGPNEFDVIPLAPLSLPSDFKKTPQTKEDSTEKKESNKEINLEKGSAISPESFQAADILLGSKEEKDMKNDNEKVKIKIIKEKVNINRIKIKDETKLNEKKTPQEKKNNEEKKGYKFLDLINTKIVLKSEKASNVNDKNIEGKKEFDKEIMKEPIIKDSKTIEQKPSIPNEIKKKSREKGVKNRKIKKKVYISKSKSKKTDLKKLQRRKKIVPQRRKNLRKRQRQIRRKKEILH
ncbi:MAG: DUF3035 domain-containing protein [Holosporales bacterium]|nr:DUF3035 domain-containing protein [Holosporales bacterium]